jgi:hypothetical protein
MLGATLVVRALGLPHEGAHAIKLEPTFEKRG